MYVDPLGSSYPTPPQLQQFFDQAEAEVRAVPGVADIGWSSAPPLGESIFGDDYVWSYEIVGDAPLEDARKPTTSFQIVSPSYFSTLDLPIVAGRAFDARDNLQSPKVVIVNEAFARSLGNRSPIGLQVSYKVANSPNAKPRVAQIVGVAKQVKFRPDESRDYVQLYEPLAQDLVDDILLIARPKTGRADALAPAVRAAIARIDKEQLVGVADITTLEDIERRATGRHRFRAVMVAAFAALAVVLAMVGVFGILAYSVQQRIRDFGVRRALGATSADVMRLVIGSAIRVVGAGAAIGLVLAAMSGRLMATMLFGVQPLDFVTFALVVLVLSITAAVSMAGPAWRAARIDPAAALRSK
jgi:putative ABC transport system permease protein